MTNPLVQAIVVEIAAEAAVTLAEAIAGAVAGSVEGVFEAYRKLLFGGPLLEEIAKVKLGIETTNKLLADVNERLESETDNPEPVGRRIRHCSRQSGI